MPERLEILMTLANVHQVLTEFARVENATARVHRATRAAAGGSLASQYSMRGAELRLAAAQVGRIVGTVGLVVGAVVALGESLKHLNEIVEDFADARLFHGATTAQTAQAAATLGAIGMSPGEAGALGARLHERIAAGGLARGAASRLGVGNVLPPGLGGPNDIEILNQLVAGLHGVTDAQDAYNLAVQLGAPELLKAAQLQGNLAQNAEAIARTQAKVFSPESQRRAQEFSVWWQQQTQDFRTGLGVISNFVLDLLGFTGQGIKQNADAVAQNTQAVQQNTVAIQQGRGFFGGGERLRGAVPAGLRGELLRKQMESDAVKLGAFYF